MLVELSVMGQRYQAVLAVVQDGWKPGVTYHVTGSDPFGLDSDNDGLGCE